MCMDMNNSTKLIRRLLRRLKWVIVGLLAFWPIKAVCGAPMADLSSPSQEVRDAAAKVLRESWTEPSSNKWNSLLGKLKVGMPRSRVMEILGPHTNNLLLDGGSCGFVAERCRLDDYWVLTCGFACSGTNWTDFPNSSVLDSFSLRGVIREPIWVDPPKEFTGVWTEYYVNGQKARKTTYKNGEPLERVFYAADGRITMTEIYTNMVIDGIACNIKQTGYDPSGRVNYEAYLQHTGKYGGMIIWYNENGSIKSKEVLSPLPVP